MWAAYKGHKDIVDIILAHNCNVDLQTNEGWTALICAAVNGHTDIVDTLLAHKCKLDLQSNNGNTALILAKRLKRVEVAALIENQLRRNRNWDHRKALMLVLTGSNYLLPSSSTSLVSSLVAADTERVAQTPVDVEREAADLTNSEKVLCDMFLVQHIMRYI
jgi:ankyrin repeat protein